MHLLPSLIPPGSLRGGVAVVVDVLRATTVMVHALAAGCEAVIPCAEIDEAKASRRRPAARARPCWRGEREGLPIPGFDLGNSPGDFTREVCRGKTLVMTTTNGTRAILASLEAERVYIASFANLRATSDEIWSSSSRRTTATRSTSSAREPRATSAWRIAARRGLDEARSPNVDGHREIGGRGPLRQRRSLDGAVSVARGGTVPREAPPLEVAEPGTRRPECDPNRARDAISRTPPMFDRFQIWSPS